MDTDPYLVVHWLDGLDLLFDLKLFSYIAFIGLDLDAWVSGLSGGIYHSVVYG